VAETKCPRCGSENICWCCGACQQCQLSDVDNYTPKEGDAFFDEPEDFSEKLQEKMSDGND